MQTPSIPQGTRDFPAAVVAKRNYIFSTIKQVFELYGYQPLETPAMENLNTLLGKYGEEGDRLIFKVLNNGLNDSKKVDKTTAAFENLLAGKNDTNLTERALRYDLTIPFARYVAMNHNQLVFPFKRYQMQPVWRADRPQKGRYREFYQCDADVVGSTALINEVELTLIYADVFKKLDIKVNILINNRKILQALAALCNATDRLTDITVAIDKLDKIGVEKVQEELIQKGLTESQTNIVTSYLNITGGNYEKITALEQLLGHTPAGAEGINEIKNLIAMVQSNNEKAPIVFDPALARGLNYYTATIFEVKAIDFAMGSIGGGGRYDDLTGLFGVKGIPGVGISFGVDRIYDVMEGLNLFPEQVGVSSKLLFFNLGVAEAAEAFRIMQLLRNNHVSCELYPENVKMDKQFKYAEKKGIPWVVFVGKTEMDAGVYNIKNIKTGQQKQVTALQLINSEY